MKILQALSTLVSCFLLLPAGIAADDWAANVPVGSIAPELQAIDQHDKDRNLDNLMGENGLMLMFNRSTVW